MMSETVPCFRVRAPNGKVERPFALDMCWSSSNPLDRKYGMKRLDNSSLRKALFDLATVADSPSGG